ncbi:alpha/beta hydrolase [Pseudidiomarina insulisalsae]|uniref:Serine aminopeptidase S33 domain-containing protein n=1 Tax=Pseudidiomarina insulisalsae TaxID=575789 RepID=A0A432YQI2_9GAMM|nr:alpha/beta fold hydrolase [Pseudidiomarina insulisalsae]RUO63610.1 hypothetical protein CWI71_00660 [Pseudidiomarina insulisalsae]
MLRGFQMLVLALASTVLLGCAAIVEERLSMRPSAASMPENTADMLRELQLATREFCLPFLGGCTGYLYGKPYHLTLTEAPEDPATLNFDVEFETANGIEIYQLNLTREEVLPHQGTMVLLHGYSVDKSAMGMLAAYFMFLGYHVIVPDLLGHGQSTVEQTGFGVRDADMISALLDSLPQREKPGPLYIAGQSMGSVAAANVARQRKDVAGLMLFAPMLPMDQATEAVLAEIYPRLSKLMSSDTVRQGVIGAMRRQDLELADTDLLRLLPQLEVPALLIASDKDTIAPYEAYLPLESETRTLIMAPGRHHMTVGFIDNELHQHISSWLAIH